MVPYLGGRRLNCRMCSGTDLIRYLDLGHQPPADEFKTPEQVAAEPVVLFPLDVHICQSCGLSQLGYVVAPEVLYQRDYPYESSTTASGRAHFAAFANSIVSGFQLTPGDLAVDVGSNVGVLLAGFSHAGMRICGVDPAPNIAAIAERRGIPTMVGFFSPELARRIVDEHGQASVITGTNVFAHVDDLQSFMEGVDILLKDRGIFVIEAPSFLNLIKDLEYDTIYHEHLSYLSVTPMSRFFQGLGMEIFDVQEMDIHGGSIRIFVSRAGTWPVRERVAQYVRREKEERIHELPRLHEFAAAVEQNREQLRDLLSSLRHRGARIAAVSTPAKGMTLLNYARLGVDTIEFATEKSPLKIGRTTPGSNIPVLPDAELLSRKPDYALLLAWNFAAEIMQNLKEFTQQGGRFIIPIPVPHVVEVP